jgi:DNA-binding CsgD family transcriptional regulator
MLLGTAHVRGGDMARGLALLHAASLRADAADAATRSEIALGTALAYYRTRDFERAERALLDVDPGSDIVYARALECRGWIAKCRNDFHVAVEAFEASLAQLDRCRQFDRFLEANLRALHEFEEVNLPVVVAETLALIGDGAGAAAALHRLDTMSPEQIALLHDEPMKRAYLAFVEGLTADANSDAFSAQHRYRDALRAFSEIGMARRALLAALRLGELNGEPELFAFVEEHAHALPASSWIRTRAARFAAWQTDPLLAELTRADREVLELLYEGKSTAQIAAFRGRSAQTIRNTVSKLLKAFGVDNRQALIKECSSRGAFPTPAPAGAPRGGDGSSMRS